MYTDLIRRLSFSMIRRVHQTCADSGPISENHRKTGNALRSRSVGLTWLFALASLCSAAFAKTALAQQARRTLQPVPAGSPSIRIVEPSGWLVPRRPLFPASSSMKMAQWKKRIVVQRPEYPSTRMPPIRRRELLGLSMLLKRGTVISSTIWKAEREKWTFIGLTRQMCP